VFIKLQEVIVNIQRLRILVWLILISLIIVGMPAIAKESQPAPGANLPTTPQLIEIAYEAGEISQETANLYTAYALSNDPRLPVEYQSDTPWDGTLPLLHLQESVNAMPPGPEKDEVARILTGVCSNSTGSLPTVNNSTHFHIQYNTIGGGLTITSYANSLETAWNQEITSFGWWAPPVLTSNPPPGNRYHVRIDSLGSNLYGYVSTSGAHAGNVGDNPNSPWTEPDAYATCMVLNSDYSGFPGGAQTALDATTAHEFNHSIQFGIGALTGSNGPDDAFIEGGATWMEDEVYDYANDNYNYLWPTFNMCMGEYTASPYPYWITFRGFSERYGTGSAGGGEQVMQDFWEQTARSGSANDLNSMNTALTNRGTTLADAFHAYAIAVKFNKTCGGSFAYPYCFEEATGYVNAAGATTVHGSIGSVGGSYNGSIPDNYAINWVSLPTTGGSYNVTLNNTSAGGQLRGSVICATNSTLTIVSMSQVAGSGQSATANGFNTSGCTSVVAVITNQAQTSANPSSCTSRSYSINTSSSPTPPGAFNKSSPINSATGVSTSPTLSWGTSSGATSYDYCYDTSNNNTCDGSWNSASSNTSVGLSGLSNSTMYYWHVRANNNGGTTYSDSNTWWSFTTQAGPPGTFNKTSPANSATGVSTSPTLIWNASSGAASYDYCYDISDNNTCDGSWNSASSNTSVGLSGLSLGTIYFWQVRANNGSGTTYADSNTWWSFTTQSSVQNTIFLPSILNSPAQTPPAAPTNLTAAATSSSAIHLAWNDNASNEDGYTVERSPDGSTWSPLITLPASSNSHDDSGLQASTPYYYRVQAYIGATTSSYSNTASATTQPFGPSVCNGNFEQGATCWTEYSSHGWDIIINSGFPGGLTPHSGSWAAWLGGGNNEIAYVQQQVTVPVGSYYLAYYHWIASADTCGYDFGGVLVNGTVVDVYNLCSSQNTNGWVKHVVNLSAYAGQTVTLQIRVETDVSNNSNLFVDDVAFQSSPSASGIATPQQVNPDQALPRSGIDNRR
jgi:hypothetical protein